MSCYFNVKLKRQGQKANEAPCILYLCTTEARELADAVDLVYNGGPDMSLDDEYGYYTRLTLDTLHEIQDYYFAEAKRNQDFITKTSREAENYKEMMPKATSTETFDNLRETYNDLQSMIEQAQDDAEVAEYRRYDFIQVEHILKDNDGYELVYYLG